MSGELSYAVGIGAANVDVHGRSRNPIVLRDSNPCFMSTSLGGVTRNIMENAARLGGSVQLIAAVGQDLYGEKILRESRQAGIGMDHAVIVPGAASSTYMAAMDSDGDMFIGMSDMRIAQNITEKVLWDNLDLIRGASVIVTDPSINTDAIRCLATEVAGDVPVFVDPVSTYYAGTIRDFAGCFHTLKPNELELEILSGVKITDDRSIDQACGVLLNKGAKRVFVSRGARGCFYKDAGGTTIQKRLRPVEDMVNATGAGDAFMGALVYSQLMGFSLQRTIDYALAAGIIAISARETISSLMSANKIETIIKERAI